MNSPEASQPTAPAEAPGRAVLVVDDEPFMCKAAVAMLKALGHDVEAVSSGAEAVARVSSEPGRFACALVDFSMTPMDGVTCFRALRAITPSIRVLIMTGYNMEDKAAGLRAEGVAAVIQKPLTLSLLRDSMDRAMPRD